MYRSPLHVVPIVLAGLLLGSSRAGADLVNWNYTVSPSATSLSPTSGTGSITLNSFSSSATTTVGQPKGVVLAYAFYPQLSSGTTATYSSPYSVAFGIQDSSGASNSVTFSGTFAGTLNPNGGSTFTYSNNGPTGATWALGGHYYVVTLNPYFDPPYPSPGSAGGIIPGVLSVNVVVKPAPEPTSLALAGLALPALVLAACRRRKTPPLAM